MNPINPGDLVRILSETDQGLGSKDTVGQIYPIKDVLTNNIYPGDPCRYWIWVEADKFGWFSLDHLETVYRA